MAEIMDCELAMLLQETPVQTFSNEKNNYELDPNEHRKQVRRMKCEVPIWEKSNLTLEEAAAYCGIGTTKLREISDGRNCTFVLWNGSKRLLKRKKLDEFLEREFSI